MQPEWVVYMVRCRDGTFYTGITTDIKRRIDEHNHDNKRGSRYTRTRRPVVIAYLEPCKNRSIATSRELSIKKLKNAEKQQLADDFSE